MVYLFNIGGVYGVQFQDVVVDAHQSIVHLWTVYHGGIAEYADFCSWTILVAQPDGVVNNLGKVGVTGGLAIACKGQHVRQLPLGRHLLKLGFQLFSYLFAGRHGQGRTVVFIEAALTVDAVEAAHLAVGRQQIDAERYAQTTAVYGPENGRWIDNCTHNECKNTIFFWENQKN